MQIRKLVGSGNKRMEEDLSDLYATVRIHVKHATNQILQINSIRKKIYQRKNNVINNREHLLCFSLLSHLLTTDHKTKQSSISI